MARHSIRGKNEQEDFRLLIIAEGANNMTGAIIGKIERKRRGEGDAQRFRAMLFAIARR